MEIIEPSPSSSAGSDDQMLRTDLESNVQDGQEKQPSLLVRVFQASVTRLKGDALSRIKALACLMTAM